MWAPETPTSDAFTPEMRMKVEEHLATLDRQTAAAGGGPSARAAEDRGEEFKKLIAARLESIGGGRGPSGRLRELEIEFALNEGNREAAARLMQNALENESSAQTLNNLAAKAAKADMPSLANSLFLRAMELPPYDPDIKRNYVIFLGRINMEKFAIPMAKQLVEAYSDNQDYAEVLAQTLLYGGEAKECVEHCRKALSRFPSSAYLYSNLLRSMLGTGTTIAELVKVAEEATGVDARERYSALANMLDDQNALREALQFYQKALELGPLAPIAAGNYAVTLAKLGQYAEAEKVWKETIEKAQDTREQVALCTQYASYLTNHGRFEEARDMWERAQQIAT